jgi:rod shape-determining protein MreC
MSASLVPKQKERESFIIHFSQPVRSFIKRFSLALLMLLAVFIIFINQNESQVAKMLRAKTLDVVSPVLQVVSVPFKAIQYATDNIANFFTTYEQNKTLRKEIAALDKRLLHFDHILRENKRLKNLLNYVEGLQYKTISAQIIGTTVDPFAHSVLINAGGNQKIKKGQAVVNHEGLVGHIVEVGTNTARVLLLSDINSRIPVISNESREHAILAGQNTFAPQLNYLHKETTLQDGELMRTSGSGEVFPSGIGVGIVEKQKNSFYLKPLVQFHRLEDVSVLQRVEPRILLEKIEKKQ